VRNEVDEINHSRTQYLKQSSSTSDAVLEIACTNKRSNNKLDDHNHFDATFFTDTGRIAWVYAGMNGGKEKVRYKFEDDVVHEPFWFTGTSHDGFVIRDSSLLREMLKHSSLAIEFSPGGTVAKFNLKGLSLALAKVRCDAAR
jgi:hypothetical protein